MWRVWSNLRERVTIIVFDWWGIYNGLKLDDNAGSKKTLTSKTSFADSEEFMYNKSGS